MAVDFYTQNFCSNYASKFYSGGCLNKEKVEEYGKKFGINVNDLEGDETKSELAKILFDKQLKINFNGTDPIKNQDSTKNQSIFTKKTNENNEQEINNNEITYKGEKLNIIG